MNREDGGGVIVALHEIGCGMPGCMVMDTAGGTRRAAVAKFRARGWATLKVTNPPQERHDYGWVCPDCAQKVRTAAEPHPAPAAD